MKTFTLTRDGGSDLRFTGELLGSASSKWVRGQEQTRWTELDLYRTESGKYVCQETGISLWQGEHNRYSAAVAESEDDVIGFFGHGWLAKELYADAGIEDVEAVD